MARGKIKEGPYGKYYQYEENGQKKNLGIRDYGEFLTEDQIDEILQDHKLDFNHPDTGEVIHCTYVTYTNKYGNLSHMIKYKVENADTTTVTFKRSTKFDREAAELEKYKSDIIYYYSDNNEYYARIKTESFLKDQKFTMNWKSEILNSTISQYKTIVVYCGKRGGYNDPNKIGLSIYVEAMGRHGYKTDYKEISKQEYSEKIEAYQNKSIAYNNAVGECAKFKNALSQEIMNRTKKAEGSELIKAIEDAISSVASDVNVPNVTANDRTIALKDIFDEYHIKSYIHFQNSLDFTDSIKEYKEYIVTNLKQFMENHKILAVRQDLWDQFKTEGLEKMVDQINIDQSLDLGRFKRLKQLMVKQKSNVEKSIIFYEYQDVKDPDVLKVNLLNMLKNYYEFNNITAKNVKSLAKFIANNNISEYYDTILQYDDAVEIIIDNSKDKNFLKRTLSSIAGGRRMNTDFLKDKSFYFEHTVKLKDNIIVNDPIKLLNDLKELIPEYNYGSDVAILTNIILNPDGYSFTYQFYTFSNDASGKDMDGRRTKYMTVLYNRSHDPKIYFDLVTN